MLGAGCSLLGESDTPHGRAGEEPWGLQLDLRLSMILLKRDGGGLVSPSNFLKSSAPDLVKSKHICAGDKTNA